VVLKEKSFNGKLPNDEAIIHNRNLVLHVKSFIWMNYVAHKT
jgi:hypothetical protein